MAERVIPWRPRGLPEDVAVLDEFARAVGLPSRSAALHHVVRMLRLRGLERDYEAAWEASSDH